jgi:hypothetical protein
MSSPTHYFDGGYLAKNAAWKFFDLILVLDVIEHLLIPVMPMAYGSERAVVFRLRRKEVRPRG